MHGKGKYWQIPVEAYPPLEQGAVVVSHSRNRKEASVFVQYSKTKAAAAVLQKYGFALPEEK
jgi:molybdate transport system substrate-binding protein